MSNWPKRPGSQSMIFQDNVSSNWMQLKDFIMSIDRGSITVHKNRYSGLTGETSPESCVQDVVALCNDDDLMMLLDIYSKKDDPRFKGMYEKMKTAYGLMT